MSATSSQKNFYKPQLKPTSGAPKQIVQSKVG